MAHHKLTQKKVDGLSRPGRYSDRGGLYATVTETGGFWTFRYVRGGRDGKRGRERWMGLGPLWDVPLAEARDGAEQARKLLRQDIDPLDARREWRDAKALEAARLTVYLMLMRASERERVWASRPSSCPPWRDA